MSESYSPNQYDLSAGGGAPGHPTMTQQRPYDPLPPMNGGYPDTGYGATPPSGPEQRPGAGTALAGLPRRIVVALALSAALVLLLGGYGYKTHGDLGKATTKIDGLEQSLDKANKSASAKQSELSSAEKQLATAKAEGEQTGALLQVAYACATGLGEAWDLLLNDATSDQIVDAYQASEDACAQLDGAGSAE